MNTFSQRHHNPLNWSTVVMVVLGFWLSASLMIDLVILPSLSAAGMMSQAGFASAGYLLFGIFNHVELLCAAVVLSGFLAFRRNHTLIHLQEKWSIALATILLVIPLAYTYILTPQMSGLGLALDLFHPTELMSGAMVSFHESYWVLEVIKLLAGVTLLRWCYRDSCPIN